jgi:beta-glucanase (GH16 family)
MYKFPAGETMVGFHEYAVEWEPGVIRWFVDGNKYYETSSWWTMTNDAEEPFEYPAPYDKPFYILLNLAIGGTSIIIMVGVALETQKQLESQMMMRHYKGFLD